MDHPLKTRFQRKIKTLLSFLVKERIIRGDFTCLALVRPTSYTIFLSSTFVDTQFERNEILEKVRPIVGKFNF